jgi:hypothetical protein
MKAESRVLLQLSCPSAAALFLSDLLQLLGGNVGYTSSWGRIPQKRMNRYLSLPECTPPTQPAPDSRTKGWPLALVAFLLLLPALPAAAGEVGTVTLAEGPLRVIRGTSVFKGGEGMRLHSGDMLESSNDGSTQLELAGGTIIGLGSSSRLFLFNVTGRATRAELVLLSGWLKGETGSKATAYRYSSPLLIASTLGGTVVLHVTPQAAAIFVESGPATVGEVAANGSWQGERAASTGQFYVRAAGKSIERHSELDAAFVGSMPVQFRDTLPSRLSHFGKPAPAQREHEVSYPELRPWLTMGYVWRKGFVERFQPLLSNAAFRKELATHLNDYPEWGSVLREENQASANASTPHDGKSR